MSQAESAIPDDSFDPALFREPERARQDLARLRAAAPEGLLRALPPLLAESPDPDQVISLLERLAREAGDEWLGMLDRNRALLHHVVLIFGRSYWLGETLLHDREVLSAFAREKSLERSLGREAYREHFTRLCSQAPETDSSLLLTRFKRREYVGIALRDFLGIATLAETAEEISALSDVMIEEALRQAESQMKRRYGVLEHRDSQGQLTPARFAVLSLGKLGGNELNYSSDADLLYIYDGKDSGGLSVREYFIRQAQLLTEILARVTADGAAFRVDLRLRPQGSEGEPAVGLRHALDYYAHAAHDWELQALIKARCSAGDASLARDFIRGVEPRVYTGDVNFEAIETALDSREKIYAHRRRLTRVRKEPAAVDLKLDRGGIRDIEFLVQCLQRVYGGSERWLRSGGTLFSLQKLHDKAHLSGNDFQELTQTYEFLRRIEHRLQLQRGLQVHRLPASAAELKVLDRAAGYATQDASPAAFVFAVQSRMARVAEIYERVVHSEQRRRRGKTAAGAEPLPPPAPGRPMSYDQAVQRASADSPSLGGLLAHADLSLHARRALHRFLGSAMTSADRYAALLENPLRLEQAVFLLESSDYLTEILVRHPDAMRALELVSAGTELTHASQEDFLSGVEAAHDLNEAMAVLRRVFRARMFAVGAQDVLSPRPASASMRETTALADAAIRCALRVAQGEESLAVFALGRLGTHEFDIASDADLLFVRDPRTSEPGARAAAEKLVHALAAYTREGTLFAVDARLRPRGAAGELVITPAQLERYLANEAQPWEALTYSKLRCVAGREDIAAPVLSAVRQRIVEMGHARGFAKQVVEMRARLEKSNRYAHSFKLARGGFYDVDFIVSFLVLNRVVSCDGNTLERLDHLRQGGAFTQPVFAALQRATLLYRTTDHVIRLVTGRARPELPEAEHARQATVLLVNRILGRDSGVDVQTELDATKHEVRNIFVEVVQVDG